MLKRFLRVWSLIGLSVIALGIAGGCVSDEVGDQATFVLEELDKSLEPAGSIELEGKVLVYPADLPDLVSRVRSVDLESDRKELVKDYLTLQKQIGCILDDVEEAVENGTTVRCQGKVLVEEVGEHGLLGITEILEEIKNRDGEPAKREYLAGYLRAWDGIQRIDRVEESLAQMKRTNSIPLFGVLVKTIHRFPILYEGDELVPKKDVPDLLDQFRARDTDEARRALVRDYLER
jgi:hypothetical protein